MIKPNIDRYFIYINISGKSNIYVNNRIFISRSFIDDDDDDDERK